MLTDWVGKIAYVGTCIALVVVRVTLLEVCRFTSR
jgi:hypothetical protein